MTKYGIPKQVLGGFKIIISLPFEEIQILSSILESVSVGDGIKKITEENIDKFPSIKSDIDLALVITTLFSIVNIFSDSKDSVDKFVDDFANSYKEIVSDSNVKDIDLLKTNLSKLLPAFPHIKLTLKAKELLLENNNNFSDARFISDIRIVYDHDDMNKKEQYALIVHHLRIKYFSDHQHNDFFVTLDSSDLIKLQKIIERALEKDKLIRGKNHELEFIDLN